jgi:hypothetical protein
MFIELVIFLALAAPAERFAGCDVALTVIITSCYNGGFTGY